MPPPAITPGGVPHASFWRSRTPLSATQATEARHHGGSSSSYSGSRPPAASGYAGRSEQPDRRPRERSNPPHSAAPRQPRLSLSRLSYDGSTRTSGGHSAADLASVNSSATLSVPRSVTRYGVPQRAQPHPSPAARHGASSGSTGGGAAAGAGQVFSRVKVAVRCRPPFEEEGLASSLTLLPAHAHLQPSTLGQLPADLQALLQLHDASPPPPHRKPVYRGLHLHLPPSGSSARSASGSGTHAPASGGGSGAGSSKEFAFDVVFGPAASNGDVYNTCGGPVVEGVLKGVNGTIICYGQTGG